jgi:hypothetical protein
MTDALTAPQRKQVQHSFNKGRCAMPANENLFTSVDNQELLQIQGGVVTIEYLVLGTFLALALIVGVTTVATPTSATTTTSRTSPATR